MPGRWVMGGLVSNVWGIDEDPGDDINLFTFQPFVNYNFDKGWYLTFAPIITAEAENSHGANASNTGRRANWVTLS